MGIYVQLDCLDCDTSLHLGKPVYDRDSGSDGIVFQGMFSETDLEWINDERCWRALQAFLCRHRDHRLVFRRDDTSDAQNVEHCEEYDDLIKVWEAGLPYP